MKIKLEKKKITVIVVIISLVVIARIGYFFYQEDIRWLCNTREDVLSIRSGLSKQYRERS